MATTIDMLCGAYILSVIISGFVVWCCAYMIGPLLDDEQNSRAAFFSILGLVCAWWFITAAVHFCVLASP